MDSSEEEDMALLGYLLIDEEKQTNKNQKTSFLGPANIA